MSSGSLFDGPVTAKRAAHNDDFAPFEFTRRLAHGADGARRVTDGRKMARIATYRNRYFTNAEHIKHVELSGRK